MLKKTSDDAEEHVVFLSSFHRFFGEKTTKNRAKRMKTIIVHKNQQKNHARNALFEQKHDFEWIYGIHQDPQRPSGTSREIPKIANFSHSWSIAIENESGRPPGSLGKAPEVPPGVTRVRFCVDFGIHFDLKSKLKDAESVQNKLKNLKELVNLPI